MEDLRIGSVGGVVPTQKGEILAVFDQCAYRPTLTGKSIISCIRIQVEDYGNHVDDRNTNHGGSQCIITTPGGYIIPLKCVQGLMYMDIRPFTDDETEKLPILVHLTRDIPWDPSRYDSTLLSDRCIAIYPNDYNGVNRRRELFHCN